MSASGSSSSQWPTPDAFISNDGEQPQTFLERQARQKAKGINGNGMGLPLAMAAKVWPTPSASEPRQGFQRRPEGMASDQNQQSLTTMAMLWPTPVSNDHKSIYASLETHAKMEHPRPLREAVGLWYTPDVPNGGRALSPEASITGRKVDGSKQQIGLENQARMWATPRAIEGEKGGRWQNANRQQTKQTLTLTGQAQAIYSPLAQVTVKTGKPHSKERRSLNPLFVEWLMGWPPGWTLLAWTASACSAMELFRFKQRMRFALSQLALPAEAPPAQLALFG